MTKRRSRHTRASPEARPPFRLTPRDCRIIKAINDCVVLRTDQVQVLAFNSPSPAYDRLEKLFHYEYLNRHFITQVVAAPAASKIVHSITDLSAALLAATFGYTAADINTPGRAVSNWKTLQPILAVNDFRVHLMRAASELDGFRLQDWILEKTFRARPDMVYIKGKTGRTKKSPVYPDGYVVLETPRGTTRFFVEIDSGTEGLEQVRSQINIYQEYMFSGLYQERFQTDVLRVVIVTNSERRLHNIRRVIAAVGGGARYWLTTTQQMHWQTLLTDPIWYKITDDERVAFIE